MPALVGVRQAVGQARAQPQHRFHVGEPLQPAQGCRNLRRSRRLRAGGADGGRRIETGTGATFPVFQGADQALARGRQAVAPAQVVQDVGQGGRAQVGHAHRLERPGPVQRVDRHDVRVLQAGQLLRLGHDLRGHLQRHQPVGQFPLPGQVDAAEGALAQFGQQVKAEERSAHLGQFFLARRQPRPIQADPAGAGRRRIAPGLQPVVGQGAGTRHLRRGFLTRSRHGLPHARNLPTRAVQARHDPRTFRRGREHRPGDGTGSASSLEHVCPPVKRVARTSHPSEPPAAV